MASRRRIGFLILLVLGLECFAFAPGAHAQVLSVFVSSYGDILKRTRELAPASGPSSSATTTGFIGILERFGGLKGLDRTRPLLATLDFVPGPPGGPQRLPKLVLYVPVSRQSELLGALAEMGNDVKRYARKPGFSYTITTPAPNPAQFFVLDSPPSGYLVATNVPEAAVDLRKIKPASFKPKGPSVLFASLRLDRLPAESKEWYLDDLDRRNKISRKRRDGESEEAHKSRVFGINMAGEASARLVQDTRALTLNLEPAPKSGKLVASLEIEASSGTETGKSFDAFRRQVSRFKGLTPDAALSMGGALPLPQDLRQFLVDAIEQDRKEDDRRKDTTASPFGPLTLDTLQNLLSQNVLDGHFSLDTASNGKTAMIFVAALKDAKKVETSLREVMARNPTVGAGVPAKLDVERGPDGTAIHKFTNLSKLLSRLGLKDGTVVYAAFLKDSVVLGGGADAIEPVKAVLASLSRPAPKDDAPAPFTLRVSLARIAETEIVGRSEMRDLARKYFSGPNAKKDHLTLSLKGGEHRLALTLEADPRLVVYAVELQNSAWNHLNRGLELLDEGSYAKAIAELEQARQQSPREWFYCNMLAWALATAPDAKLRDGKRAVELATLACELTNWKVYRTVDTLAAALAEAGNFDEAVRRQEQALELLTDDQFRGEYQARLSLYKARKPFHLGFGNAGR